MGVGKFFKQLTGVQAIQDRKKAKSTKDEADELLAYLNSENERRRTESNKILENFGRVRLEALKATVAPFLGFLDFMKHNIEGLYDYILCANILHEDKKDCVLKKTYAALRQGGKIIVDVRVSDYPKTLSNSLNELSWYVKGKGKLKRTSTWFNFLSTYGFKQISLKGFYEIHAVITAVKE